jgi:hypothetical protein
LRFDEAGCQEQIVSDFVLRLAVTLGEAWHSWVLQHFIEFPLDRI